MIAATSGVLIKVLVPPYRRNGVVVTFYVGRGVRELGSVRRRAENIAAHCHIQTARRQAELTVVYIRVCDCVGVFLGMERFVCRSMAINRKCDNVVDLQPDADFLADFVIVMRWHQ